MEEELSFDSNRVRNLVRSSNRRNELKDSKEIYRARNTSGVFVHAIFIRPFQWEMNRDHWTKEESESIQAQEESGKMQPLKFVRKLMKQSGMISDLDDRKQEFLTKHKLYPYEFKHGDLIKIVIIDHNFPSYPEFRDNDSIYVVLRNGLSEYQLGIFPLNYSFDVMGSVCNQIKFDGIEIFPDAYKGLLKGGEVCHCNDEFAKLIVNHMVPKIHYYDQHPIPLYRDDEYSSEYGFILSEFEFKEKSYRFVMPFNLNVRKLTLSLIKKAMKERMDDNGFVCELLKYQNNRYTIFIHDYILVRGNGVYRTEIKQNLWDYFHTFTPESFQSMPKIEKWLSEIQTIKELEIKIFEEIKNPKVKTKSLSSIRRHALRKSHERNLQFELEDVFAHSYISPLEVLRPE